MGAEALAAVNQEVGRIQALDTAAAVARAEGTRAAEAVVNRDKDAKAGQLKAFKSFLWSLEELAGKDAGAVADPQETRLVFRLYRLEENGGVKPTAIYQTAVSFSAAEALGLGDPDFEGRAQTWAEKAGRFGRYQWRILGWAAGEQTLDTTYNLNTEAPAGYEPPKTPMPELRPEKKDPMEHLKDSLGLIGMVKDALGLGQASSGKADGATLDLVRSTARAEARTEAMLEGDRILRERIQVLEDRWEQKVESAKSEAYTRGLQDGKRAAEDEWRPKVWELERQVGNEREPSIIEEAVRMVGGPEIVQALARTFIATGGRPAAQPSRPVVPLQHRMPATPQTPPAVAVQSGPPEPTRTEWREALGETEEAIEIVDENDDGTAETAQLRRVLEAFRDQGEADGTLGNWWQAWQQFIRQAVHDVLRSVQPEEEDKVMELTVLRDLLAQRLAEGATDQAILKELGHITTPEARAEWRKNLAFLPDGVIVGMIGGDPERIKGLFAAFMAGN